MIEAVIFDMDGLLIDSEPLWRKAEKEVFAKLGVDLEPHMFEKMMGYRIEEVVAHWRNEFGWDGPTNEEVRDEILVRMKQLIIHEAPVLPGVHEVIQLFERVGLPMSIASSSHKILIEAAVEKLAIGSKLQVIHSAEHEPYGKPHPAVFLSTARLLGVAPKNCLVFEDSLNGVKAGKAAGMTVVAIPEQDQSNDERFKIADMVLTSLTAFNAEILNGLQAN